MMHDDLMGFGLISASTSIIYHKIFVIAESWENRCRVIGLTFQTKNGLDHFPPLLSIFASRDCRLYNYTKGHDPLDPSSFPHQTKHAQHAHHRGCMMTLGARKITHFPQEIWMVWCRTFEECRLHSGHLPNRFCAGNPVRLWLWGCPNVYMFRCFKLRFLILLERLCLIR